MIDMWWRRLTSAVLFIAGAGLVIAWSIRRFIRLGDTQTDVVRIREITAVILAGALLMLIGAYLSVYQAKKELEIERSIVKTVADLIAKALTVKRPEEEEAEAQAIPGKRDDIDRNLAAIARDLIGVGQTLIRIVRTQKEENPPGVKLPDK